MSVVARVVNDEVRVSFMITELCKGQGGDDVRSFLKEHDLIPQHHDKVESTEPGTEPVYMHHMQIGKDFFGFGVGKQALQTTVWRDGKYEEVETHDLTFPRNGNVSQAWENWVLNSEVEI